MILKQYNESTSLNSVSKYSLYSYYIYLFIYIYKVLNIAAVEASCDF